MMKSTWQISVLAVMLTLGISLTARWASPQAATGSGTIIVDVPADARVIINDHQTHSTGTSRTYYSRGLIPARDYPYRVRVVGQYLGKPWSREQTVVLRAGETKRLVFRYSDPPREQRLRVPVPDPEVSLAQSATGNGRPVERPSSPAGPTRPAERSVLRGKEPAAIALPKTESTAGYAYFAVPLEQLHLTGGNLPPEYTRTESRAVLPKWYGAWATVDDGGEAYIDLGPQIQPTLVLRTRRRDEITGQLVQPSVPITGQLFLPSVSAQKAARLSYEVVPSERHSGARCSFYDLKRRHYQERFDTCPAGRDWFLRQTRSAESQLLFHGLSKPATRPAASPKQDHRLMEWYSFLTGGRAVTENLDLKEYQSSTPEHARNITVDSIRGINVPAFDWRPLMPKEQPALDPLAAIIPADQHAVFFPSIQQAHELAELATDSETVFLRLLDPQTVRSRIRERYEQQFGISLDELVDLLSRGRSKSVALTGSDPYVAMGTDAAILIESSQPAEFAKQLAERIASGCKQSAEIKVTSWTSAGMTATGVASADRRVCSYVAALPQAVVLTNSVQQLQRLADVQTGSQASLASLPEFTFFRDRYRLGDPNESAFVVISDATIRRWGSPCWRIGQARRRGAAVALGQWQAEWVEGRNRPSLDAFRGLLPSELDVSHRGVYSRQFGSLDFLTPVSEIPLNWVNGTEKVAYEEWRNQYERRWAFRFDPIAMRFAVRGQGLEADVTVMPLTIQSEYREFRSLMQGVKLRADAGDPHESCVELAVAVNKDSEWFRFIRLMAHGYFSQGQLTAGADPLEWFDGTVTVYLDRDPAWEQVARKSGSGELLESLTDAQTAILSQVPVGIQVEATNGVELTKFLVALRAVVESSAPGMLKWELCEHDGRPYTKVSASEMLKERGQSGTPAGSARLLDSAAIYYTAYGDALIISLNERVLQRAIDRRIARQSQPGEPAPAADRGWLGDNVAVRVDAEALRLLAEVAGDGRYQRFMQTRSWSNLPILNEWKRLYPDEDPVAVHERLWNVRPVCPGGGDYVWNETWQTMESTVYGHPAAPKTGPSLPDILHHLRCVDAGLTFETNGLRTKFRLDWTPPAAEAKPTSTGSLSKGG